MICTRYWTSMLFSSISCHDWDLKWLNELIKVHRQRCQRVTERCSSTLESGSATLKVQVRYFPKLLNSGNFRNFTTLQSCESCQKLQWTFSWWEQSFVTITWVEGPSDGAEAWRLAWKWSVAPRWEMRQCYSTKLVKHLECRDERKEKYER